MSFATNSDFLIPIPMKPHFLSHLIFKTMNSVSFKKFKFEISKIYAIIESEFKKFEPRFISAKKPGFS